jgi:hypothetical protein
MFKRISYKLKRFIETWKPIHLCWWFRKHGWKIPKYFVGNPDDIGPNYPATAAADTTVGSVGWSNINNIKTEASYADVAFLEGEPETKQSYYAKGTNYGFNLPYYAVINGILVEIKENDGDVYSGQVLDASIKLVVGGVISGNDKQDGGAVPWGFGTGLKSYGGASDLWGLSNLVGADINAADFGAVVSCKRSGTTFNRTGRLYYIRITVYYTVPVISGIVKIGETPVEGATVRLVNQSGVYVDDTVSDVSGEYSFNIIETTEEKYHVIVEFTDTAGDYGEAGLKYNAKSLWDIVPVAPA